MTRHPHCTPATVTPHQHDPSRAPRWRFADPLRRIKGCPLKQDRDAAGVLRQIACRDLKGTLPECKGCWR